MVALHLLRYHTAHLLVLVLLVLVLLVLVSRTTANGIPAKNFDMLMSSQNPWALKSIQPLLLRPDHHYSHWINNASEYKSNNPDKNSIVEAIEGMYLDNLDPLEISKWWIPCGCMLYKYWCWVDTCAQRANMQSHMLRDVRSAVFKCDLFVRSLLPTPSVKSLRTAILQRAILQRAAAHPSYKTGCAAAHSS